MTNETKQLNGDILKLTAAISMMIDHIGAILFPNIMILRIIGRIAFPVFVFFIAEGCRYTNNKKKYLFNICLFAAVTQLVKCIFGDTDDFNVLFTLAASVMVIYTFQLLADSFKAKQERKSVYLLLIFVSIIIAVWALNRITVIQYGFWGCMAPFIVYLSVYTGKSDIKELHTKCILLAVALSFIYFVYGGVQGYAYFAIPLLMLYSGEKGNTVPKYFFYMFYPMHLTILYMINIFI